MTPEQIERTLADFRDWLTTAPDPADEPPADSPVDLATLVGQFTALRQDVNLQTKATRTTLEQNATLIARLEEAVDALQAPEEDEAPAATLPPMLKTLIDVYDTLALAHRQIEKQQAAFHGQIHSLLESIVVEMPPAVIPESGEKPTFWQKFFGNEPPQVEKSPLIDWHRVTTKKLQDRQAVVREMTEYLRDALAGILTGYAMGMHRIDRMLTSQGLEIIRCTGRRFDPEEMEVAEAVNVPGKQLGEVLDEVRRGYTKDGIVVRFAQVRVAR